VELDMLPTSGRLAIEVDGLVEGYTEPGDRVAMRARPQAARVIRLGRTTFYQRARRKLRLTDSAEIPLTFDGGPGQLGSPQLNNPLTHRDGEGPRQLNPPLNPPQ
jgi:hypothetical protein